MSKHILRIEAPDTYVEAVFLLRDMSTYSNLLPVSCLQLQILPPGYNVPAVLTDLLPGFNLVLNACTIGVMGPSACNEDMPGLPDGIYNIQLSCAPNTGVFVEYNHLRITDAINKLNNILCGLQPPTELPDQQMQYEITNIGLIREYLIAAKTMVENLNEPQDGINMYRWCIDLMNKMSYHRPFCRPRV